MTLCIEGIWRIVEDRLPIVIYKGHSCLWPAIFERCVPSDIKIKGTSVSPSLSVDLKCVTTSSPSDISPYLCLPPPVRSMHLSIEVFRWRIAGEAMLRGVNMMLSVGWLPHQPSHAFDDVSTPVFDRVLVIVIPSHILDSAQFPLPRSLIIWHACNKVLDTIPVFDVREMQSGVFFLQCIVIVRLHALLLDLTLEIFVLFTRGKRVVGIAV